MSERAVHCMILAGGRGARLAPLTTVVPKPLMPLGDRTIIEVLLGQLGAQGFREATVTLGHLGHLLRAVLGDGERLGVRVAYTEEPEPLGTAGPLRLLDGLRPGDDVLVLNGDTLTDLDFRSVVAEHRASGAAATVVASRRVVHVDFGVLEVAADGELQSYREKPTHAYLVSTGINVLRADAALAALPPSGHADMPALLLALRERGERVRCYETDAFWLDLGRVEDLREASELVAREPQRFLPSR